MLQNFTKILLGFFYCFSFFSCQKELSFENGTLPVDNENGSTSGTAVFSLAGSPNTCSDYNVGGNYCVGVPVNAGNCTALKVLVTTPGTFAISSPSVNGIFFHASGTFDNVGMQSIILHSSGIPSAAGSFNFKPGTASCTFPVNVTDESAIAIGDLLCEQAWSDGNFNHGMQLTDSNKLHIPVNVSRAGLYSIQTTLINGTSFSGSGSLPQGAQTIDLNGTGMPEDPGSFLLTVNLGESSCSMWITYQ